MAGGLPQHLQAVAQEGIDVHPAAELQFTCAAPTDEVIPVAAPHERDSLFHRAGVGEVRGELSRAPHVGLDPASLEDGISLRCAPEIVLLEMS